jgi:hypothetical protein
MTFQSVYHVGRESNSLLLFEVFKRTTRLQSTPVDEEFLLHKNPDSETRGDNRRSVAWQNKIEVSTRLLVILIAVLLCFFLFLFFLLLFLHNRSSNAVQVPLAILRDLAAPVRQ